ncbi:MAG: CxxxxCH/CxxCH domain-containing protein [Calditrichaeota bacterium]|nr:MAG: CxxxxCH/CxxCH domain-containing protein [Calditrichota bacterium]
MNRLLLICLLIFLFLGCSEDKAVSTLPPTHPSSWINSDSPDFHGNVVINRATAKNCMKCHGEDMDGGISEVSCIDCHLEQGACVSCHGGVDNLTGAPPKGLDGETSPTTRAVGAHTAHLNALNAKSVECQDCHYIPAFLLDTLHINLTNLDSIAELTFSNLAENTIWHRTSDSCSNSYCHGNFDGGNTNNHPIWTDTLGAECGSCHSVAHNMSDFHMKHISYLGVAGLICGNCHGSVIDTLNNFTDKSLHVNGVIDTLVLDPSLCYDCHASGPDSCYRCHGGLDNLTGAPPTGLDNETSFTDIAVGAHTAHVAGNRFTNPFDCDICHIKPDAIIDTIHLDGDNIAEVTFNSLAGNSSIWNRTAERCENVYCHGNFDGGTNLDPVWTAQNQADCGSCHDIGVDPGTLGWKHEYHISIAGMDCSHCHSQVVDDTLGLINLDLHINGVADTTIADQVLCDNCHGSEVGCVGCHGGLDNQSGAPPYGLEHETATTVIAVGAHTAHVTGNTMSDGVACESCHSVPATVLTIGHLDGDLIPEVTFGGIAGGSANWNRGAAQCTNTYCHGNFPRGYAANSPIWNSPNQSDCGTCHPATGDYSSMSGRHYLHIVEEDIDCYRCHSTAVDDSRNIVGYDIHVNGVINISFSSGHGRYDGTLCTSTGCHGTEYWQSYK